MLSILAQSSTMESLEGVVIGESSSPVHGAYVLVHDNSPVVSEHLAQNWEMRTGSEGRFSFKVPVGCYDVFVSATVFAPRSERVCVKDGYGIVLKLKLKSDRRVMFHED